METRTGNDVAERHLVMLCERVQRLLRLALSDWYGYLSRESLNVDTWRYGVPWWVKKVPNRLDCDWALNDLRSACVVGGPIRPSLVGLVTAVDEIVLALERDEGVLNNPPEVGALSDALSELVSEVGGGGVVGV